MLPSSAPRRLGKAPVVLTAGFCSFLLPDSVFVSPRILRDAHGDPAAVRAAVPVKAAAVTWMFESQEVSLAGGHGVSI